MKAEIIAIGSELLTPDFIDTNSLFLTSGLNEAGFEVHLKTVVGDSENDICSVLQSALLRSDVVVLSGGLGPTEDDRTRAAVARILNRQITIDPRIIEHIHQLFSSRGYRMAKINERQAEVIEGAEILPNTNGTAPGQWVQEGAKIVVLLPGPPREIRPMFETQVLPKLRNLTEGRRVVRRSIYISGMTESQVDELVAPTYRTYESLQTTILAGTGHISLHLTQWLAAGESPSLLEELEAKILERLGDAVFSTNGETLEEVIGYLLRQTHSTVAVAESCTSGMIGARITRVPGSSKYFLGGVQCYSNEAKISLCDLEQETLTRNGAVSAEVAEALANGIRRRFGSTFGLSITGIAGPGGGSAEKPVGLVFVGVADADGVQHHQRIIPGDREAIRERATFFALASLRKSLLK